MAPSPRPTPSPSSVPLAYRLFFLYIEPLSAIVGAWYAHLLPHTYLALTHAGSAPPASAPVPTSTAVVLSQLANLYLLFALNEALVLRCTSDLRVWRTLLLGLLVADLGHLYSVRRLGPATYWQLSAWNAMTWGNVGFVYAGAAMRVSFLSGLGLARPRAGRGTGMPKET